MADAVAYTEAHEPHDEQLSVWADEVAQGLLPWLRDFNDYEDKLAFFSALTHELRHIAEHAHEAGMIRATKN